jgi:hypothetical protein
MAISTYGVTLKYGASTATTPVVIKDFPQVLGSRSALETTTLSDDAQTFIPGIRQQSETLDFTANFDATVMSAINALKAVQKCELAFSDGSKYTWDGWVSAAINEGSVDAVVEMTISITPTSVPVFTAGGSSGS